MSGISPILLLVIVILAVIFFLFGILHLLIRYFTKRPSFSSSLPQSNRFPDTSAGSHVLQRQLQHLFRLHDSGLDQAIIDALPMFYYKDITGLKEPFDCAVCLCEFLEQDMLRLLPLCCHAFHIHCIDTWLLSNSTCPLCRGLIASSFPQGSSFDEPRNQWHCFLEDDGKREDLSGHEEARNVQQIGGDWRVFSVRLGKFLNQGGGESTGDCRLMQGEISRCNLDARRCFSMGSCQYVVGDSELQVSLPSARNASRLLKGNHHGPPGLSSEGKKISARTEGESFSISKIWLWSKKGKLPSCPETNVTGTSLNNLGLSMAETG
ncbi:PREDICTED: RING-H2 finger protein ATL46-like [Ipomoea nil]|uniref:RING-H2 finger protein ATL46-like n=1 Tax=Ipomoea nil TaxID=35883 RepID=UPI000901749A|nr:PREDICTED: RING-H2 finger protein ATL46-like [Ipomoea nil]